MGNKVLIIEDAKSLSKAIQEELRQNYEIQSDIAETLADAKTLLSQNPDDYFIATVDLQLPDCQPGEAATLTNQHHLPTIIFTGQKQTNLREQFSSHNLVDYVFKSASSGVHYVGWLIHRVLMNRNLKVLVVDDSPSARATLVALLEMQGFQVEDADNGAGCLEKMENQPDLIVLDEYLPDCLGHELCRDIRNKDTNPLLQIIGVSSKWDKDTASIFLKCGGNDFIARPFNPEEFTNRINHRADYLDQVHAHRRASEEKTES
jgi:DNA-binding response OmpR family regulator